MSTYSNFSVHCPQDESVEIHAITVLEKLAQSFETFRDKISLDALEDVHTSLLLWEELHETCDPSTGVDVIITVTTEDHTWEMDLANDQWVLDLRMSIFHGRLIFMANAAEEEGV